MKIPLEKIEDGESCFPNSCVPFVRFSRKELQFTFSWLRQKEDIAQRDIRRLSGPEKEATQHFLHHLEGLLLFMANFDLQGDRTRR